MLGPCVDSDYTLLDYYFTGDGKEGLGKAKDARSE